MDAVRSRAKDLDNANCVHWSVIDQCGRRTFCGACYDLGHMLLDAMLEAGL